jgi:integrase
MARRAEGWNRQRLWRLHEPEPVEAPVEVPSFHEFASEWFAEHQHEWADRTRVDYRWRLSDYLLPFFARHRLSEITIAEVDHYKAATLAAGKLSPATVNKTLVLLSAILETAEERELIARNTARGRRRRLRVRHPKRTYLDTATQIGTLLDAAGELDAEAQQHPQPEKRLVPRRATLATLVLAGLRISELCELRWRHVDLAAGRLRVGDAKADAGRRDVRLLGMLRDELAALKARAADPRPEGYVFATARGGRQSPSNVRQRILAKAVERANVRLGEADELPLPDGLTPHGLRRTFASILYALGESPAEVMAQLGHTDPGLALRIYASAMRLDEGEKGRLRALVGGSHWAAMGSESDSDAGDSVTSEPMENENPRRGEGSAEADDGTRTHDLLHGKQTL